MHKNLVLKRFPLQNLTTNTTIVAVCSNKENILDNFEGHIVVFRDEFDPTIKYNYIVITQQSSLSDISLIYDQYLRPLLSKEKFNTIIRQVVTQTDILAIDVSDKSSRSLDHVFSWYRLKSKDELVHQRELKQQESEVSTSATEETSEEAVENTPEEVTDQIEDVLENIEEVPTQPKKNIVTSIINSVRTSVRASVKPRLVTPAVLSKPIITKVKVSEKPSMPTVTEEVDETVNETINDVTETVQNNTPKLNADEFEILDETEVQKETDKTENTEVVEETVEGEEVNDKPKSKSWSWGLGFF